MPPTIELSQDRCRPHGERYCYQCAEDRKSAPLQVQTEPTIEDQLVGRSLDVAVPAPVLQPAGQPPVQPTVAETPKAGESVTVHPLVVASQRYAAAIAKVDVAVRVVADLEKRLDIAKDDAVNALAAKDSAFKELKELTEAEKSQ